MRNVFNFNYDDYQFQLFSLSHLLMIAISIFTIVILYISKDKFSLAAKRYFQYFLLILLFLSEASFQYWYILNDKWDVAINLPFQLCSLSLYLCMFMLITKSYRIFELTFFVSMTGAFVAMITPELFFGFPHFRFFQFFMAHLVIIITCLYMLWIEKYQITFHSLIRAFIGLNILAIGVFILNKVLDSNYMFLIHKPVNPSLIDLLGPYPWYILSLELISFILFLILYSPFYFKNKSKRFNN
ncbi:TIGR02206 family membrane protein [Lottiidibacillus patelloidae]|uniref:TIGR02206 family membrane protein n=1 Tax=Lottiidibacillus patelloidae TaxID=2670334 RepID=A0A263BVE5_9BACI|nr:TIGR02206 family membrane protein [Lottiidibacillus patelloidae]OZM57689.1 TIGR02206 family membrane protein [Lottiidibacillus patelloidae]